MSRPILVVGGSVAGLVSAVALARDGHHVTVLERDAAPLPETPEEAFARWERRGSPQTRQSHAFLARLHNLLRDRVPDLLDFLLEHGAERMRFRDLASRVIPAAEFVPADDDITMLACRRVTFEWALRRFCAGEPRITLRDGETARGLVAEVSGTLPRVRGVRLAGGEALRADLVVDASGRHTPMARWLTELGAREPRVEREPCGIFYASRFYRLRDGVQPPPLDGPMAADLGFLKYGIFPGDSGIFSVTLAASPEDEALRGVLRERGFDALASALPATAPWVAPSVAEPITGVHGMAKLENVRRFPVEEGEPLALGLVSVGDALIHTNPIVGRGCTLAAVNAFLLADALREHPDDPFAMALSLDMAVEREIVPWYDAVRTQDRDSIQVARMQRRGEDPFETRRPDGSVDPRATLRSVVRDGLLPALREDIGVLRAFMRLFNLLEPPADLMKDPALLGRVLAAYGRRAERDPAERGPTRDEVIAHLERAA